MDGAHALYRLWRGERHLNVMCLVLQLLCINRTANTCFA